MLATMGELFISSGFIKDQKIENLNNINNDDVSATYTKGSVFIEVTKPVTGGMRDYSKTVVKTVCASPFDIIGMNYDGREIRVPALLLLNSWSNCLAEPEGLFFNYRDENIDWNTLDDKKKDGCFYEFVAHYLPSGFVEAFGNPVQMIVMSYIAILTGGLFAELGTALAAAGIGMSVADAKGAVGGIIQANNEKNAATTMHEAKKAAKHMAKSIAKLTLDVINIICTVAGYLKGKKKIAKNETVDSDATVKKYIENLNEKSIEKLRKRDDGYEILKSYEEYFGDNIDFVNELIENTPRKEIYVEPKTLIQKYIDNSTLFEDCKDYTKQIQRLDSGDLQQLINEAKKITDEKKLKNYILDEVLTPAERAASWQGSHPYVGVDKYNDIMLKKGDKIYILESEYEIKNKAHSGYATNLATVEKSGYDSKRLSESLQIKPYYDEETDAFHAYYRDYVTEYTIEKDFLECAYGEETLANIQFGDGEAPQFFFKKIEDAIAKGYLKRGKRIKLKNTIISYDEFDSMMEKIADMKGVK